MRQKWIWVTISVYIIIFSFLSVARHNEFYSGWDLGVNEQVLWNTKNGHFFYSDEFRMNYLGNHFNLIFLLLMPLYYLLPYTGTILILQTIAIAIGMIPLYQLAKLKTKSNTAAKIVSVAYIINPLLWYMNLNEFHPVIFAVPLLLYAVLFMEKGKWRMYWVCVVLLLVIKENISLVIAMLGIYLFFLKNKKIGLKTFIFGLIWFLLTINLIMPALNQGGNMPGSEGKYIFYVQRYSYLGENTAQVLKTLITKPAHSFTYTDVSNKIFYVSFILLMFAFLPLISAFTLVASPLILQNILSTIYAPICPTYTGSALVTAIFFVATIYSLEKAKVWRKRMLAVFLAVSIIFSLFTGIGTMIIGRANSNNIFMNGLECYKNQFIYREDTHKERYANKLETIINSLPKGSYVLSTEQIFPHTIKNFKARTGYFTDADAYIGEFDYLIADRRYIWNDNYSERDIFRDKYNLLFEEGNLSVFGKKTTCQPSDSHRCESMAADSASQVRLLCLFPCILLGE